MEWIVWGVAPHLVDLYPFEIDPGCGTYWHEASGRVAYPRQPETRPTAIFTAKPGFVAGVRPGMLAFGVTYPALLLFYSISVYDTQNNRIGHRENINPGVYQTYDTAAVALDFSAGYDIGRVEIDLDTDALGDGDYDTIVDGVPYHFENTVLLSSYAAMVADVWYNEDGQDPRQPFWTNFVKTREVSA